MNKESNQSKSWLSQVLRALKLARAHWYLFILAIGISGTASFLHLRYSSKSYQVSASLILQVQNENDALAKVLETLKGGGVNSAVANNELEVLRSFGLVRKTLDNLDFRVSYVAEGAMMGAELYTLRPFEVILDSTISPSFMGGYEVLEVHQGQFQLLSNEVPIDLKGKSTFKWGEKIKFPWGGILINKQEEMKPGIRYFFRINNLDRMAIQYRNRVQIDYVGKQSSVVNLSLVGTNYRKDIDFLNAHCDNYIYLNLVEKLKSLDNAIFFIEGQLNYVQDSLNLLQNNLLGLRSDNKVYNISEEGRKILEDFELYGKSRDEILIRLKFLEFIEKSVVESGVSMDTLLAPSLVGIQDPLLTNSLTQLHGLYDLRQSLILGDKTTHPKIQMIDRQIASKKGVILTNVRNIEENIRLELNSINSKISVLNDKLRRLPANERRFLKIERGLNLFDNLYNYLLEKKAELGMARAGLKADHRILDYARSDMKRGVGPNRGRIYFMYIFLGLIIPSLFVYLRDLLNDKVYTEGEIKSMCSFPVLGQIQHGEGDNNLMSTDAPKGPLVESFRSLRTNLSFATGSLEKGRSVCIGITSTVSGEGKTFCSLNLSAVLGFSGKRVLLVGADLRKPGLRSELELDSELGLSNFLATDNPLDQVIQKTKTPYLDIILSGSVPPNPAELLAQDKVKSFIEEVRERYDYIIFDTPPVGVFSDFYVLVKEFDIVLYLVRSGFTKTDMVKKLDDQVQMLNLEKFYIILNDLDMRKVNYYGYGYSYGYGYNSNYYYGKYGYNQQASAKRGFLARVFKGSSR